VNKSRMLNKANMGFIFVISGPSGSGKTTLAKKVLKQLQSKHRFIRSVSFTTRPKRPGERQGRDYLFVSTKEFQRLLKAKKFLEHTCYLGYDYGTPRALLEQARRKGLHIILCLDIKGALFLKRAYPDRTITIFLKPPSLSVIRERILGRFAETKPEELNRRLQLASKELGNTSRFDYCLVNDNLNKATKEVKRIIQQILGQ
jgi:guanylate kinase